MTQIALITDPEQGTWVEYTDRKGVTKKWDDPTLTPDELAKIMAAGMIMQSGTTFTVAMSAKDKTNGRIQQLQQLLEKAEKIVKKIIGD